MEYRVLMVGHMDKKSPKGVDWWQRRFFALLEFGGLKGKQLLYFRKEEDRYDVNLAIGTIPLTWVVGVEGNIGGKDTRLNIELSGGRFFELIAESKADHDQWVTLIEEGRKEDLANPLRPPDAPPPIGTKEWWKASAATAINADGKEVRIGNGDFIAELASPRARGSNMFGRGTDDLHIGTPSSMHGDDLSSRGSFSSDEAPPREISHGIASPFLRAASFTRGSALLSNDGRRESGMGLLAVVDPEDRKVIHEGWLKKKSPSGIPGARPWQRRYFKLTRRWLAYTKSIESKTGDEAKDMEAEEKNSGRLYVSSMKTVMLLERSKCRFIIVAQSAEANGEGRSLNALGDRMFELIADTSKESRAWVMALESLLGRERMALARDSRQPAIGAGDPSWGTQSMDFRSVDLGSMLIEPLSPDPPTSPLGLSRSPPSSMGMMMGSPRVTGMGPAPSPIMRPVGLGPLNMQTKRDSGFALGLASLSSRPLSPTGGEQFVLSPRNVVSPTAAAAAAAPKKSGLTAALAAAKKSHRTTGRDGSAAAANDDTNNEMPKAATPLPVSWLDDSSPVANNESPTDVASPRNVAKSPSPVSPTSAMGSMNGSAAMNTFFGSTTPSSPSPIPAPSPNTTPGHQSRKSIVPSFYAPIPDSSPPKNGIDAAMGSPMVTAPKSSSGKRPPLPTSTKPRGSISIAANATSPVLSIATASLSSPTNSNNQSSPNGGIPAAAISPLGGNNDTSVKSSPFDAMIIQQATAQRLLNLAASTAHQQQQQQQPSSGHTAVLHKRAATTAVGTPSAASSSLLQQISALATAGQQASSVSATSPIAVAATTEPVLPPPKANPVTPALPPTPSPRHHSRGQSMAAYPTSSPTNAPAPPPPKASPVSPVAATATAAAAATTTPSSSSLSSPPPVPQARMHARPSIVGTSATAPVVPPAIPAPITSPTTPTATIANTPPAIPSAPSPVAAKISARPTFTPPAAARAALSAQPQPQQPQQPPPRSDGTPIVQTGPISAPSPVNSSGRLSSTTLAANHRVGGGGGPSRAPPPALPPPPSAGTTVKVSYATGAPVVSPNSATSMNAISALVSATNDVANGVTSPRTATAGVPPPIPAVTSPSSTAANGVKPAPYRLPPPPSTASTSSNGPTKSAPAVPPPNKVAPPVPRVAT